MIDSGMMQPTPVDGSVIYEGTMDGQVIEGDVIQEGAIEEAAPVEAPAVPEAPEEDTST